MRRPQHPQREILTIEAAHTAIRGQDKEPIWQDKHESSGEGSYCVITKTLLNRTSRPTSVSASRMDMWSEFRGQKPEGPVRRPYLRPSAQMISHKHFQGYSLRILFPQCRDKAALPNARTDLWLGERPPGILESFGTASSVSNERCSTRRHTPYHGNIY